MKRSSRTVKDNVCFSFMATNGEINLLLAIFWPNRLVTGPLMFEGSRLMVGGVKRGITLQKDRDRLWEKR